MNTRDADLLQRAWVRWVLYFGFWTCLGWFNVGQSYIIRTGVHQPFDFANALILGLSDWYLWAIFTLVIVRLGRWFPLEQGRWASSLAIHILACLAFTTLTIALLAPLFQQFGGPEAQALPILHHFQRLFVMYILFYYWMYFAILGVSYAVDYYRQMKDRELRASQLEAQLVRAQLQVLKMQLHPHFLFNTLHAISSLMHKDLNLADRMIARLGELLRQALKNEGTQETMLREELEFLQPYLEIERARLGSRLSVRLDVEPNMLDAYVPHLVLQPLVENAIIHGIAPRSDPGWIEVRAWREGATLILEVEDDGPGLPPPDRLKEGIGLANTRARLQQLYATRQQLSLHAGTAGGLLVRISVPYRTDVPDEPAPAESEAIATSAVG